MTSNITVRNTFCNLSIDGMHNTPVGTFHTLDNGRSQERLEKYLQQGHYALHHYDVMITRNTIVLTHSPGRVVIIGSQ